jgi:hypothetical protein
MEAEKLFCNSLLIDYFLFQVFVLMQFDPGMEYRPDWGSSKGPVLPGGNIVPGGPQQQKQQQQQQQQHGIQRGAVKGLPPINNSGIKGPPGAPKDDKS